MQILNGLNFVFSHPLNKGQFLKTAIRVSWWKMNQIFFKMPTIVQLTNKIQCICYPDLSYSGLIVYTKWPDFAEWNFLQQYLQSDHIFIDIGAHTGDYSLLAADKITQGKIFAFEPEPTVLPLLQQNVRLNALEQLITIIPQAVSNKQGKGTFTLDEHSETSHLTKNQETAAQKKVVIQMNTLDNFFKQQKLKKIDVLKIDVEGAEGLVFEGGKKLIQAKKVDLIFFELNPRNQEYGASVQQIFDHLTSSGYQLLSFSNPNKLISVSLKNEFSETQNLVAVHPQLMKHSLIKKYLRGNVT